MVLAALGGCRDERSNEPPRQFIPDMDDGPKFKPQSETGLFLDGRTMRPRVAGTVAFGSSPRADDVQRSQYLKESTAYFTGVDPSAPAMKKDAPVGAAGAPGVSYAAMIPKEALDHVIATAGDRGVTLDTPGAYQAMLARGHERYTIFCAPCHGESGEGGNPGSFTGGVVGRRWGYPVPSFHDAKYKDRSIQTGQDGYIFHVIRNGVPDADKAKALKMPAYGDRVSESDAWSIVYYVRVLQASMQEDLKNVPADMRAKLEATRPALPTSQGKEAGK